MKCPGLVACLEDGGVAFGSVVLYSMLFFEDFDFSCIKITYFPYWYRNSTRFPDFIVSVPFGMRLPSIVLYFFKLSKMQNDSIH